MIIIFYNTLLVLFLSLSFTTSGISSSIPQFGQTSRSSRRVPQRLTSKLNIKKSKWIVHLYPNCTHQHFARHLDQHLTVLRESSRDHSLHQSTLIIHEYQHVLHGLAIQDIDEESLQALPCIKSYVRDSVKRLVSVPSWGIDRIDQENLPLDNKYETTYTGRNVDVYILDTGLDTNHVEFAPTSGITREVKNIFNAFASNPNSPGSDTDGHGHGTHVAGTIGGKTVGVAKGVNIYSLKILSDEGEGDTSDIIAGLELIHSRGSASNHRSIMSMSLGGDCEGECSSDSLVMAVESLYKAGILSSVASGNAGCNGCFGSPNSAPHAVNVGATDIHDEVTFFSNYGPCVDIFAPGYNIISASPKSVSHTENQYVSMSGTSMACPHVTGTLALTMEKYPIASIDEIVKSLLCDAAQSLLSINPYDTTSRNLLLQIPRNGRYGLEDCPHVYNCPNGCSNGGICLPSRVLTLPSEVLEPLIQLQIAENSTECYCEAGYHGPNCENNKTSSCDRTSHKVTISLFDSYGDGWSFGRFSITNLEGRTVLGATDSLCEGSEDLKTYCLPEGKYVFSVDKGMFPQENQWTMCGISGGAPYTGVFLVESKSHGSLHCKFICEDGNRPLDFIILSSSGDGWTGAFYAIYSQTGAMLYGGTLIEGEGAAHHVCFPKSECSIMMIRLDGEYPSDISYEVCGYTAYANEILQICVDEWGRCTAETQEPPQQDTCPSAAHPSITNHLSITLMNFALKKYMNSVDQNSVSLVISDSSKQVLHSTTITNQFINTFDVCLIDGCYNVELNGATSPPLFDFSPYGLWMICGQKGLLPLSSSFCLDHEYNFCYGLGGCPVLVSRAHTSEHQYFVLYDEEENGDGDIVDMIADVGPIHGVYDMCDLDGTYKAFFGAGKSYDINELTICQESIQIPAEVHVHITGNGSSCHLSNINKHTCDADHFPHDIMKIDDYGDGWGKHAMYTIKEVTGAKAIVATGKMNKGQIGIDSLCLAKNRCYTFSLTDSSEYVDEILWVLCGYVGDAPVENLIFCVEENSCRFTEVSDSEYTSEEDDDFPDITPEPSSVPTVFHSRIPSFLPSLLPTQYPQSSPTFSPSLLSQSPSNSPTPILTSVTPTIFTSAPTVELTHLPSHSPTILPSKCPTLTPTFLPSIQDDDAVYDQPYHEHDSVYLLRVRTNISFLMFLDTVQGRLTLQSSDFQFLEFSLRKKLEAQFVIWNSSYIAPSRLESSPDHENAYLGSLSLNFDVRVPTYDFDFFSLKQSLEVALRADYLSGVLQHIVSASLAHQIRGSDPLYPITEFLLTSLVVFPGVARILSYSSTHPSPYPALFIGLNLTDLLPPEEEALDESTTTSTSTDYWDSHAWFALTVSGFTLASIFLCYLFFLLFRCRVKRMDPTLLPAAMKNSNQRKGYAKVNAGHNDSSHNDEHGASGSNYEGEEEEGRGKNPMSPSAEIAKRVGKKIMKGMKEGLRRAKQHRDVEDGSGFVELDNLDSDEEITLDLNEMAQHQSPERGRGGAERTEENIY